MSNHTSKRITTLRSGLITCQAVVSDNCIHFTGPLTFDGDLINIRVDHTAHINTSDPDRIEDAIIDLYLQELTGWTARKSAPSRKEVPTYYAAIPAPRHTPCPTLWAGR